MYSKLKINTDESIFNKPLSIHEDQSEDWKSFPTDISWHSTQFNDFYDKKWNSLLKN